MEGTETTPKSNKNLKVILIAVISIIFLSAIAVLAAVILINNGKGADSETNLNSSMQNSSSDNPTGDNSFEQRAKQAQLTCEVTGHQNYRTQQAFAIDPTNSNTLYLGVEFRGVFKSVDGGDTWTKSDEGILGYYKNGTTEKCVQELGKIIIDPNNPERIIVSRIETPGLITDLFSETAGIYLSENSGSTWKQLVKGNMNASGSKAIGFDPRDGNTIYYGVNNGIPSYDGAPEIFFNKIGILYKTTDNGQNWNELKTGVEEYLRSSDLLIDGSDPNKLWLGAFRPSGIKNSPDLNSDQSNSLLLSTDSGKTWESVSNRLQENVAIVGIAQSKLSPKNIYLLGQSIDSQKPSPSFYSTDGGITFKKSSGTSLYAVGFDQSNITGTRLLSHQPFANTPGIFESTDAGATWKFLSAIPAEVDSNVRFTNITWDPNNSQTVYINGDAGTVMKSTDNGKTWDVIVTYKDL